MLGAIWAGAGEASDIFLLIAIVVTALATVIDLLNDSVQAALLPLGLCLIALGLFAL